MSDDIALEYRDASDVDDAIQFESEAGKKENIEKNWRVKDLHAQTNKDMNLQFDCIERPLSKAFGIYGRFIARHPLWFLFPPLLLAGALASGFYNFTAEYDVDKLFTPEHARSKDERDTMQNLFPEDDGANFSAIRLSTLGQYGKVIVTTLDADGNVLTDGVYRDVLQLDADIRNFAVEVSGKRYNYSDLCAGSCRKNILLWFRGDLNIDLKTLSSPVHTVNLGRDVPVFIGNIIGGVSKTSLGATEAKAWQLLYHLRSNAEHKEAVKAWQNKFLSTLGATSYRHISVARFTAHSLEDELAKNAAAVIPLFSVTFAVLITFSIVSCMSADWVRSKPWLGNIGVLSAGLAVISAFGLVLHCGVPFIDIVSSSPFLVLGIGVDDMFVMLAAWRRTDFRLSVEERMGKTFSEAALSITITSITDALSIGIGAITQFRSVRIFCTYTVVAVFFDYFYQITFFGACMVLMGKREERNLHPATCMKVVPKSQAGQRNALFRFFCTGGFTEEEEKIDTNNGDVWAMTFFRDYWGRLLSTRPFKILLAHVYLAYIAFAIWGCMRVKEGITLDRLAGDASYVADYYKYDIKYFREYGPTVNVIVGSELDMWQERERRKVDALISEFEASEYFHGRTFTNAWTRDFSSFIGNDIVVADNFSSVLGGFLQNYNDYRQDVKLEFPTVKYSRFIVYSKNMDTSIRQSKMMLKAREIADGNLDLKVTVFHPAFIFYDQYVAVWPNMRQNMIIATAAMFVVSLLLIPHPVCSLWVTFSIVSICTGVIGYMAWWGVNLDTISMINIIMCIGFCVDFSAHITYAFVSAEGDTGNERMRNALHALGFPIAQGALSTILGVVALGFSSCYIFRAFFKTMFLVIFLGAFHGLLVIPALLSFMGPKTAKQRTIVSPVSVPRDMCL